MIATVVAMLFALSASLYAATVPIATDVSGGPAIAGDSGEHGGCHGTADHPDAPAHPMKAQGSCCDMACHAWLPAAVPSTPPPLPAATTTDVTVAAVPQPPADGIDRPPRP
ncbi:MAG: hypothetical protein AB7O45_05505 [Alphaproteobacteria bacterium]